MAMSFDLARAKPLFDQDRERFQQFLTAQATVRGLAGRDDHSTATPRSSSAPTSSATRRSSLPSTRRRSRPINETEPQIGMFLDDQLRRRP